MNKRAAKVRVVFLIRNFGFPRGMASTHTTRLLAKSLVEMGADVTVLATTTNETVEHIENTEARGETEGIRFEYTTGTPLRGRTFLQRRVLEFNGILNTFYRIAELAKKKQVDVVYMYFPILDWDWPRQLFILFLSLLKLPVILELCERPWTLSQNANVFTKRISPLYGVKGVIAISDFLADWARQEAIRINRPVSIIKVPVLFQPDLIASAKHLSSFPSFLYSASAGHDEAIIFIVKAMKYVWMKYPQAQLLVSTLRPDHPFPKDIVSKYSPQSNQILFLGHLPKKELFALYTQSWGLLAPLFNDIRSRARFPTKIAEYLSARRPVVTSAVGEINNYFIDNENAYITATGAPEEYAKKIIQIIENLHRANQVGNNGYRLGSNQFDYKSHKARVFNFFEEEAIKRISK